MALVLCDAFPVLCCSKWIARGNTGQTITATNIETGLVLSTVFIPEINGDPYRSAMVSRPVSLGPILVTPGIVVTNGRAKGNIDATLNF